MTAGQRFKVMIYPDVQNPVTIEVLEVIQSEPKVSANDVANYIKKLDQCPNIPATVRSRLIANLKAGRPNQTHKVIHDTLKPNEEGVYKKIAEHPDGSSTWSLTPKKTSIETDYAPVYGIHHGEQAGIGDWRSAKFTIDYHRPETTPDYWLCRERANGRVTSLKVIDP